jgi:hypothetical protein
MSQNRFLQALPIIRALLVPILFCFNGPAVTGERQLAQPSGPVILEITGNLAVKNFEHGVRFDYEMLQALGAVELEIETPWTKSGTRFGGVLTRKLMEFVGASGKQVHAVAMDGYSITIPLEDLVQYETLLALNLNGERMRLRTKGPSWVIYHPSDRPDVPDTVLNSRMIWQLKTLEVK